MPILVDSDEEGTKSKVKRAKQEAAPAIKVEGNGSAFKGDTVDLLSDSEEEAGAALQPEAALVQDDADPPAPPAEPEGDKDHVDVLRVQQPWLDMLLDGHKTWELRTTRSTKVGHRIALGISGWVYGLIDFVEVLWVGDRVGQGHYQGQPADPALYWLRPEHSQKHRCTEENFAKLALKGNHLYAWVMANPVRFEHPVAYRKVVGPVTWSLIVRSSLLQQPQPSPQPPSAASERELVVDTEQPFVAFTAKCCDLVLRGHCNAFVCKSKQNAGPLASFRGPNRAGSAGTFCICGSGHAIFDRAFSLCSALAALQWGSVCVFGSKHRDLVTAGVFNTAGHSETFALRETCVDGHGHPEPTVC